MQLTLLTPHRKIVDNEQIAEVFAPGFAGQLDILEGHANLVTSLETGELRWRTSGESWTRASVSSGILEIFNGHVTIAADVSELANEIDVKRAQTAETKARQRLEEGGLDDANFRKYSLKLQRAIARQSIAAGR